MMQTTLANASDSLIQTTAVVRRSARVNKGFSFQTNGEPVNYKRAGYDVNVCIFMQFCGALPVCDL